MKFFLFLVLNAILLIRPEEILPDIEGLRLYLITISLCLLFTWPEIVGQLTIQSLVRSPVTICILGILISIVLSTVLHGLLQRGLMEGSEFVKVILYYLVLTSVLSTRVHFTRFLGAITLFVIVLSVLGLLQFHGVIDVDALRPCEQREFNNETGEIIAYPRLCSSGIYSDPNDLCLILTTGTIFCLALSSISGNLALKLFWLLPTGLFGYAMVMTKSRGGILGLMVALFTFFFVRLGPRRGLILGSLCLPVLLLIVGGRQASLSTSSDTAQDRMKLWAEGIAQLASVKNFFTGIGVGQYVEEFTLVAHNSFVHAYVETGLIGGTIFFSAFYLAIFEVYRLPRYPAFFKQPRYFRNLRPFILAMLVGYMGGAFSVSRNMVVPTYMILGIATSYSRICLPQTPEEYQISLKRVLELGCVGVAVLVFLKFFTQSFVQYN